MNTQILFVAPFADLASVAEAVVAEKLVESKDLIRIVRGDLQECLTVVGQAIADGVEVVVSRGGTADLIGKNVKIPIVHIQVTVMDMLQALMRNGKYPARIGVAGFENMIYGCEEIEKLLGVSLREILIQDEQDAVEKISRAAAEGIELIVGDSISIKVAQRMGLAGELIHSGKAAILRALQEALLIAKIRREEQEKAELLRTVIDKAADGMIVTDVSGDITIMNPAAEKIFKISHLEVIGKKLDRSIPQFCREATAPDSADIQKFGEKNFAVQRNIIKVKDETTGVVYTLQNVSQVQQLERSIRKKLHQKGLVAKYRMEDIVGTSPACCLMKRKAGKYALTQSTILITGESGTGKEMLVQSIHNVSMRSSGPFVAVNCAALPENLLESELFGYSEGAFTGAKKGGRQGLFELAHGGTLFLDEIGEMPLVLQSRLLRVLQEKAVMHIGGDSIIPVDVRIIAATNQNLAKMVETKQFRQDLYYRLNILRIHMPTLAQRQADIPLLARAMVKAMREINPQVTTISSAACEYLQASDWPGNIRQLANTIERVMLLSGGSEITRADIIEAFDEGEVAAPVINNDINRLKDNLLQLEEETLRRVLQEENFNYSRAALRLGIHRTTLWRKLNKKL